MGQGFSFFTADDLGNLGVGEVIVRVGRKEADFNLRTVPIERGDELAFEARRRDIRARSLSRWGVLRREDPEPETPRPAEKEPEARRAPPGSKRFRNWSPKLQHHRGLWLRIQLLRNRRP